MLIIYQVNYDDDEILCESQEFNTFRQTKGRRVLPHTAGFHIISYSNLSPCLLRHRIQGIIKKYLHKLSCLELNTFEKTQ